MLRCWPWVVQEPRCPCGYLLYRLEGTSCPECGRTIDDQDRWPTDPDLAEANAPDDFRPTALAG